MCLSVKLSVILMLTSLFHSGLAQKKTPNEKLVSCCTSVTRSEIQEPITAVVYQRRNGNCVEALIFHTENNKFCIYPQAPWVISALLELKKKQAQASVTSAPAQRTTVSLLSIITSTVKTTNTSSVSLGPVNSTGPASSS